MKSNTVIIRHWLAPFAVLVLTLSLTIFAWQRAHESEDARELERFDDELAQAYSTMSRAASGYVNALRMVQTSVNMQNPFSSESWQSLLAGMEWKKRFPAMLDLGLAYFDAPPFQGPLRVHLSDSRSEQPRHASGYDFGSDPLETLAWQTSLREGVPVASEVKEIFPGTRGVVLFIPLWSRDSPPLAHRSGGMSRGFVFASMNPAAFYADRIESSPRHQLNIELLGLHAPNTPPLGHGMGGSFDRVLTVPGVGQPWDVHCTRGPGFASATTHTGSWTLLGGGLLVSLLSSGLALTQSRKQRVVEARVQERTAELHHALRHEREMHEMKTRFVHLISHEFRTPLSLLLASSGMLERYAERLTVEERQGCVRDIASATRRMNDLLEQVLVLGRSEAGFLECAPLPINLHALCTQWMGDVLAGHSDSGGINLNMMAGDIPAQGDAAVLRLIFTNLLDNAVKYSPPGTTVNFTVARRGLDTVFTITNHGPGILAEDLPHLFVPFHRGANVTHIPGTGLGLVVVSQCVTLHAGELEIKSGPHGTTAIVKLPLDPASRALFSLSRITLKCVSVSLASCNWRDTEPSVRPMARRALRWQGGSGPTSSFVM